MRRVTMQYLWIMLLVGFMAWDISIHDYPFAAIMAMLALFNMALLLKEMR